MQYPRIGNGYDVHVLTEGRRLILCGVTIDHDRGLLGHSDADVAIHALCDALLGAMALGDIGRHFPGYGRAICGHRLAPAAASRGCADTRPRIYAL